MADDSESKLSFLGNGFGYLPVSRQLLLLIGLAASIAIGVSIVLWAKSPDYRPLFTQLSAQDMTQITSVLEKKNIRYTVDPSHDAVLVPADVVYETRLMLVSEGLPKGQSTGFDVLNQDQGLTGSSQFVERARYVHALEQELARTIASIQNVKSARVHLALPKSSVFIQDQQKGTASVFVELYGQKTLNSNQVSAIVHLVASSVPQIDEQKVTVVDQQGHLLSTEYGDDSVSAADRQLRYIQDLEQGYTKKIEDLLTPIYGPGKIRAKVSVEVDFTESEQTKEMYNPDLLALRSEQVMQESTNQNGAGGLGVPGALSNEPQEAASDRSTGGEVSVGKGNTSSGLRRQYTKNYEVDKTISRIRHPSATIERVSVAVLIDDRVVSTADNPEPKRTPIPPEEIQKVTLVVREAVGYSAQRGDSVTVMNSAFGDTLAQGEPLPPAPLWEKSWFWQSVKWGLGSLGVLFLMLGVLRPFFRNLIHRGKEVRSVLSKMEGNMDVAHPSGYSSSGTPPVGPDGSLVPPASLMSYQDQMKFIREMSKDDPKRVAQVIRKWLEAD